WYPPTITAQPHAFLEGRCQLGADKICHRLAVLRNKGIEIDQVAKPFRGSFGHSRDHHAAVTVTNQHHAFEVFAFQHGHYILNVGAQVNLRIRQMGSFAQPRERWSEDVVPRLSQNWRYPAPDPTPGPGAVHKKIGCHIVPGHAMLSLRDSQPL